MLTDIRILKTLRSAEKKDVQAALLPAEKRLAERINSIESDVEKIFELEKAKGYQNAFIIVNKTKSKAYVCREGKIVDRFDVGVGEQVGDDLHTATYNDGIFSKEGRTTPSGHFCTVEPAVRDAFNKNDFENGGAITWVSLEGVHHPADYKDMTGLGLHIVPKSHPERIAMFAQKGQRRNMSMGCVNFLEEDFKRMIGEIRPTNTSVYILPEDAGNKLELVSLPSGLWMKTKYADENKENILWAAMRKMMKL